MATRQLLEVRGERLAAAPARPVEAAEGSGPER
jgi:hypothetical protein